MRRFIQYLNPKQKDTDIPKQTCMGEAVLKAVGRLDIVDAQLVSVCIKMFFSCLIHASQTITSLVTGVFDGWTTKRRRPFLSFSIQYIHSPPEDPYKWSLKTNLLAFRHTIGRHTGIMLGKELENII